MEPVAALRDRLDEGETSPSCNARTRSVTRLATMSTDGKDRLAGKRQRRAAARIS
jgi:hypothetical protein